MTPTVNPMDEYNKRVGQAEQIKKDLETTKSKLVAHEKTIRYLESAHSIIQTVAKETQEQLEYQVSELGTLALGSIFDDDYQLNLDFELRRNKTEADITISKGDAEKVKPMEASGGGVADVASFGLRTSLLMLKHPKPRPTVILDEPFRYLDREAQVKAGELLQELKDKLGIQFIVISHDDNIVEGADKLFQVRQKDGISSLTASN